MGVRVIGVTQNADPNGGRNPENVDSTQTQREVTVDGYTFHFGINEKKNFLDEGVGAAVAAFASTTPIDAKEDSNIGNSRF